MTRKLSSEDRQAIDQFVEYLQNSEARNAADGNPAPAPTPRVEAVSKILQVLGEMPASEPSPELVARTLERITSAPLQPRPQETQQPYTGPTQLPA
jgi:hypothetical protein